MGTSCTLDVVFNLDEIVTPVSSRPQVMLSSENSLFLYCWKVFYLLLVAICTEHMLPGCHPERQRISLAVKVRGLALDLIKSASRRN